MTNLRPYVICHMGSTIDGRIISEHWGENLDNYSELYEQCHNTFNSDAWMVGRVTMEKDFTEGEKPGSLKPDGPLERKPFIGNKEATSFAIAVDAKGKLGWNSNEIEGDHVIEILSEAVPDEYLAYLQQMGVSYVFAGKAELDLNSALEQLHQIFGIKKLMLEGGGSINGSFLQTDLIDEISLLVLPLADGTAGTATTFELSAMMTDKAKVLKLTSVKQLAYDVIWLKYTMK